MGWLSDLNEKAKRDAERPFSEVWAEHKTEFDRKWAEDAEFLAQQAKAAGDPPPEHRSATTTALVIAAALIGLKI
jgi:hypothetical protein